MLLELARLFSRLYTYKRTHAAYAGARGRGCRERRAAGCGGHAHPRNDGVPIEAPPSLCARS